MNMVGSPFDRADWRLKAAVAAAFCALAVSWAWAQFSIGSSPPSRPVGLALQVLRMPAAGTRIGAPALTTAILVLSSCESCSRRSLAASVVRAASRVPTLVIVEPDDSIRTELRGSLATIVSLEPARKFGPWVETGPSLVLLDADGRVRESTIDLDQIQTRIEAMR